MSGAWSYNSAFDACNAEDNPFIAAMNVKKMRRTDGKKGGKKKRGGKKKERKIILLFSDRWLTPPRQHVWIFHKVPALRSQLKEEPHDGRKKGNEARIQHGWRRKEE